MRWQKKFVGKNFRHLPKVSSLFADEFSTDKVFSYCFESYNENFSLKMLFLTSKSVLFFQESKFYGKSRRDFRKNT